MNKKPEIIRALEQIAPFIPFPIYWGDIITIKVLGANHSCLKAMGAKNPEDVIGKTPHEYYPKEIADKIVEHAKKVIQTKLVLSQEDIIRDITTGKTRYYSAIRAPLLDSNQQMVAIIGTSIEITAEKESEWLIREQQEQFRKIAAQVAHDIGSPLASLKMIIPHCTTLPENTRSALNKAAIRISDIAENFLGQFRPKYDGNLTETQRIPTLIMAEIFEILTEKKYQYNKLSVDFTTNISQTGAFAFINVDVVSFKRMLSNLINNAVDAFEGKIGEITIGLDEIDKQVLITVTDNGKGMPEEVKNKILANRLLLEKKSGMG